MKKLGVNIDHIATLREARKITEPDPVFAAGLAEMAGAHGITAHLREDRRHMQDSDLYLLRKTVKTSLNMEMALSDEIIEIAFNLVPDEVCIVPERREEVTTEGGLDAAGNFDKLKTVIPRLQEKGIVVSLFIAPDMEQVEAAYESGAEYIELHTGAYAEAKTMAQTNAELGKIVNATKLAVKRDLRVNAGHGLNYRNVMPICTIPPIETLNIGHSIVARSVFVGFEQAVREMLELIRRSEG